MPSFAELSLEDSWQMWYARSNTIRTQTTAYVCVFATVSGPHGLCELFQSLGCEEIAYAIIEINIFGPEWHPGHVYSTIDKCQEHEHHAWRLR
jgi:hypothetical protein